MDADQVVRADLKELWTMDLKGAPYAYTPFCSSREVRETMRIVKWCLTDLGRRLLVSSSGDLDIGRTISGEIAGVTCTGL